MFRLYHVVDRFILGWWCDFKQVVSCGGLTCLVSRSMGLNVPKHAVDYCFWLMHACLLQIYNHALPLLILL
jgi:hypothetical protein